MRKVILIIAVALCTILHAQTQTFKPPLAVMAAFKRQFPDSKPSWADGNGGFEAKFTLNGAKVTAMYDHKGIRRYFDTVIKESELPATALKYLRKNYPGMKIDEAIRSVDNENVVIYEAKISDAKKKQDVIFDLKGNFIRLRTSGN